MRPAVLRLGAIAAIAVAAVTSSCTVFSPRPDPSRFFTLTPISDADAAAGAPHALALGIGPITFPRYLDRPEIVTRIGPNEVQPAAFDYWAGSLPKQFEGALAQNLQALTASDQVQTYPWYAGSALDYAVEVDVRDFERNTDGQVHLSARWRIRKGAGGKILRGGESNLARPVGASDPGSTAAALSGLLGDFSREIARGIGSAGP